MNPTGAKNILVVDDDSATRRLLSFLLERAGYDVAAAEDGATALEMISTSPPDILITDLMMQRMNGYELCQKVRSDKKHDRIKIVVLTARDQTSDIERLKSTGVDVILEKPIDPREFARTIRALVERPA